MAARAESFVLVVDDEHGIVVPLLESAWCGFRGRRPDVPDLRFRGSPTPADGIAVLESAPPGAVLLVLLDYHFDGVPGRNPHTEVLSWLCEHPDGPPVLMLTKEPDPGVLYDLAVGVEHLGPRSAMPRRKSYLENGFDELLGRAMLEKLGHRAPEAHPSVRPRLEPSEDEVVLDFRRERRVCSHPGEPAPAVARALQDLGGAVARVAEVFLRLGSLDEQTFEAWKPPVLDRPSGSRRVAGFGTHLTRALNLLRLILGGERVPLRSSSRRAIFLGGRGGRRFWCNVVEADRIFTRESRCSAAPREGWDPAGCLIRLEEALKLDPRHVDAWILAASLESRRTGASGLDNPWVSRARASGLLTEEQARAVSAAASAGLNDGHREILFLGRPGVSNGTGLSALPPRPRSRRPRGRPVSLREESDATSAREERIPVDFEELHELTARVSELSGWELEARLTALEARSSKSRTRLCDELGEAELARLLLATDCDREPGPAAVRARLLAAQELPRLEEFRRRLLRGLRGEAAGPRPMKGSGA